ncbi:uncharacterized protein RCO7_06504 [Rhynchosporium graminicola]|uniref:BTB domain-containing protein n=1 Tax=Rhynchosporium graminicola TaxID=2792576 RepID=A0A1E1KA63_9HELO|nr:uncharacterized protein RCO7_06504 [Rhynchosporium commune]
MSPDTAVEEFCQNLGIELIQLQAGIPHNVILHVHRKLIDKLHLSLPTPDTGVLVLKKSNPEVLEQFVVWLYSTTRSKLLLDLSNMPLLLDIYAFAKNYEILHLEEDCLLATSQFPLIFFVIEPIMSNGNSLHVHTLISDAVTGAIKLTEGFDTDSNSVRSVHLLIGFYMFGLKLESPTLCNMTMDALQQHMGAAFVFTYEEIDNIFRRTHWCPWAPIRAYCAALIHYQRNMSKPDGDQEYIDDDEAECYLQIPGFRKHYGEYERAFRGFDAQGVPCWDPRLQSGFEKCYFHHHSMEVGDEHRAECGTGDSEAGSEEEEGVEEDEEEFEGEDEEEMSESEEEDEEDEDGMDWHQPLVAVGNKRKAEESEDDEEEEEGQGRRKLRRKY